MNKKKNTFTRSDIEASLRKEFPNLTKSQISDAIEVILDSIIESVALDEKVEIRGFGTLSKKINKENLKEVSKILNKNSVHHEEFGIITKNDMIINEKTKLTIDELKSYYTNWLSKYMS